MYDYPLKKIAACEFDLLGHFLEDERLYSPRSVRHLNNKVRFSLENKKGLRKLLVPDCHKFHVKLRNF